MSDLPATHTDGIIMAAGMCIREGLPPMEAPKLDPTTGEDEMALANAALAAPARERNPNDPATWGNTPRNALGIPASSTRLISAMSSVSVETGHLSTDFRH